MANLGGRGLNSRLPGYAGRSDAAVSARRFSQVPDLPVSVGWDKHDAGRNSAAGFVPATRQGTAHWIRFHAMNIG
jgi:hypothetical protein